MIRTAFAMSAVLLSLLVTSCGKSDDPAARAARLSKETEGAVFNSGLGGVIQKGQSVALDAALTLTQNRIVCILENTNEIAQIADCGEESGWISSSAKIPLKELEGASISVNGPDRGRGEDGWLVFFSCRKDAGQCVHWTNPMPSAANGAILCKTAESCAEAAADLSALVALAQPAGAPPVAAATGKTAELVSRMSSEVEDAIYNYGETGSIERHRALSLETDGALRLNAEICVGKDGRTLDIARCGVDFDWTTIIATFPPHELNPDSIGVFQGDSSRGESGLVVGAKCWPYAEKCARWTAPAPDQTSISLNCKNEDGCQVLKEGLLELVRSSQQELVDAGRGARIIAARMSELRRDLTQVSEGLVTVKKGGEISVDDNGVLQARESSCVLESAEGLAEVCASHPEYWSEQETSVALTDIDPTSVEDSSMAELMTYTFYLKCRADRGDCITQTTTGAYEDARALSGTNLVCRDNETCGQMAAHLITLVQSAGS